MDPLCLFHHGTAHIEACQSQDSSPESQSVVNFGLEEPLVCSSIGAEDAELGGQIEEAMDRKQVELIGHIDAQVGSLARGVFTLSKECVSLREADARRELRETELAKEVLDLQVRLEKEISANTKERQRFEAIVKSLEVQVQTGVEDDRRLEEIVKRLDMQISSFAVAIEDERARRCALTEESRCLEIVVKSLEERLTQGLQGGISENRRLETILKELERQVSPLAVAIEDERAERRALVEESSCLEAIVRNLESEVQALTSAIDDEHAGRCESLEKLEKSLQAFISTSEEASESKFCLLSDVLAKVAADADIRIQEMKDDVFRFSKDFRTLLKEQLDELEKKIVEEAPHHSQANMQQHQPQLFAMRHVVRQASPGIVRMTSACQLREPRSPQRCSLTPPRSPVATELSARPMSESHSFVPDSRATTPRPLPNLMARQNRVADKKCVSPVTSQR
jgi:hypothetical protein